MHKTWLLTIILTIVPGILAQPATTSLSGKVVDETEAMVVGAAITVLNPATGFFRETTTNAEGTFNYPFLPAGNYKVTITQPGFAVVEIRNLILNVNDPRSALIRLKVRGISEAIVIYADTSVRDTAGVSTVIDRGFVERLPLNGQGFQSLITLTPGAVISTSTSGITPGQFSFNGQRPASNYFMVDGVSANIQAGLNSSYHQAFTGALPGLNIFGGFNNLVSLEALQEINILTSAYAPEFGRTPGAQVSIVTRSGTNDFHGSLFNYFRNDALDTMDWFGRKPPLRHNDFGGVVGGPISFPKLFRGKRSFFFFSYEGLRLRQPQFIQAAVPSLSMRSRASDQAKPFLDAFPIPNAPESGPPEEGGAYAHFSASYSTPSKMDAASIRLDHTVNNRMAIFGRFNEAPSENVSRNLSSLRKIESNTRTLTIGGTLVITPKISNDFRANYSRTQGRGSFSLDDFGGAVPLPDSMLFPGSASRDSYQIGVQTGIKLPSVSIYRASMTMAGPDTAQFQRQYNLVDTFSISSGAHQLKLGIDYRRMSPVYRPASFRRTVGLDNLLEIETAEVNIYDHSAYGAEPIFTNLSIFAQDTWRAGRDLSLTYGLRWEMNPPPSISGGSLPSGVISFYNIAEVSTPLLPAEFGNVPPRKTSLANFAPRFGLSYRITGTQNHETILRGGIGIFYDLGAGYASFGSRDTSESINSFPFKNGVVVFPIPNPISVSVIDPELKLPFTLRWSVGLERSLGEDQTISATYVAALGRRLPNTAAVPQPGQELPDYGVVKNEGRSDYHGLQVQYRRRFTRGLQVLANHTWSHSIDLGSRDFQLGLDRGPSDFDLRHVFSGAVTYDLPALKAGPGVIHPIFNNWSIDSIIRWQSALPVNPVASRSGGWISGPSGDIFLIEDIRPDLVPGIPLYIKDRWAPGGKRINPAAFRPPVVESSGAHELIRQGTLGRNALRGFPFDQIDISLRRRFNITEKLALNFRADIFNLFNRSNFSNPDAELYDGYVVGQGAHELRPSPSFGKSTSTVGGASASGGGAGYLSTLYQIGGARSIQLSLKLEF
jgi:Carboxypeptidase regulatory-like domain/TonB dependent receptor